MNYSLFHYFLLAVLFTTLAPLQLSGQEVIQVSRNVLSSASHQIADGNFILSGTLGEPVIRNTSSDSDHVTVGFQQPIDLKSTPIFAHQKKELVSITAYPNPSNHACKIELSALDQSVSSYDIYSLSGKLITRQPIAYSKQQLHIDTHTWPEGIYQVLLRSDNIPFAATRIQIIH